MLSFLEIERGRERERENYQKQIKMQYM